MIGRRRGYFQAFPSLSLQSKKKGRSFFFLGLDPYSHTNQRKKTKSNNTPPYTHTKYNSIKEFGKGKKKKQKKTEVWVSNIKLTNLHPSTSKIDRVLLMSQAPFFFFPTTRKEHFLVLHFLLSIHSSREGWFFLSGQIIPQPMVLLW